MKSAHGPYALKILRAPGQKTARNRKWPAAHSSSDALRVPGRHAPRDEKRSTGPLALGASHAPGRNLGLGRESFIPPRLKLGPVSVSRPSQSDGCVKFSAEQNHARRPRATLPLIPIFSAPLTRRSVAERLRQPTGVSGGSAPEAPP
jgi:hypothetical protein